MNTRITWTITLLVMLSVIPAACGGAAETVAPAEPEAAVEEPAVEAPAVEEPAPVEEPQAAEMAVSEPDLRTAFDAFLADMEHYNTITPEAANELLTENPDVFFLDVRQPEEVEENGHIEGAVNIPLRELGQHLDLLPSFDAPIVSYCGSGWRCTIAMTGLEAMGWETVYSLKGGSYGGWVEAGYPTVEGPAPEAAVLNAASPDPALVTVFDETFGSIPEGWGVITADALATELVENPDLILIDVRRQDEMDEQGIIDAPTVIHIPLEEFVEQQALWPADFDAPIVTYCGSGHRSTIAMTMLWAYGYTDVRSLKGGFGGWVDAAYPVITP